MRKSMLHSVRNVRLRWRRAVHETVEHVHVWIILYVIPDVWRRGENYGDISVCYRRAQLQICVLWWASRRLGWEMAEASVCMRLMFAIYFADGSESGFAHLCVRVLLHNSHTHIHTHKDPHGKCEIIVHRMRANVFFLFLYSSVCSRWSGFNNRKTSMRCACDETFASFSHFLRARSILRVCVFLCMCAYSLFCELLAVVSANRIVLCRWLCQH